MATCHVKYNARVWQLDMALISWTIIKTETLNVSNIVREIIVMKDVSQTLENNQHYDQLKIKVLKQTLFEKSLSSSILFYSAK